MAIATPLHRAAVTVTVAVVIVVALQGGAPLFRLPEVFVSQELAGLEVHELRHVVMQDQVLESASAPRAPINEEEEAKVGDEEQDLDRERHDKEHFVIFFGLSGFIFLENY